MTAASASTDTITVTHDLVADDKVVFTDVGASTTIVAGRAYWVKSVSTTVSFKIAATQGGTAITVGTATVSFYATKAAHTASRRGRERAPAVGVRQRRHQRAGHRDPVRAVRARSCASRLRTPTPTGRLTSWPAPATSVASPCNTIVTDFGVLNVAIDRVLPADAIAVVSLEQVSPVFLSIPGKGVLFEEELAKVGSSDRTQIYGEIGLEYGNEAAHGVLRGLYA